jgi:16S rRNA (guanine527-N7)-methyltransferase
MRREGFPQATSTARCGVTSPLWHDLAKKAEVTLDEAQVAQLSRYIELLLTANARMNLTRITDPAQAAVQHVGDALTLLPFLPRGEFRLADVGTGGGVPGIPLAIARPEARVLLIESTKKKAVFLRETIAALGLTNVDVSDARAEDAGRASATREQFDIVTARAVGTLDWLAEWCLPLTKIGGRMLAMKGPRVVEELPQAGRAIKLLGGGTPVVHNVELSGATGHVIVEIKKVTKTDLKYPRPATVAKGKRL